MSHQLDNRRSLRIGLEKERVVVVSLVLVAAVSLVGVVERQVWEEVVEELGMDKERVQMTLW